MITDNNRNYDSNEPNFNENNQSYVDQYQQEQLGDEETQQEQFLVGAEDTASGDYLDNEFSNALERDDQEDTEEDFDDSDLEEDDLEEDDLEEDDLEEDDLDDDLVEDYDENDREPETFTDDSLKID